MARKLATVQYVHDILHLVKKPRRASELLAVIGQGLLVLRWCSAAASERKAFRTQQ